MIYHAVMQAMSVLNVKTVCIIKITTVATVICKAQNIVKSEVILCY